MVPVSVIASPQTSEFGMFDGPRLWQTPASFPVVRTAIWSGPKDFTQNSVPATVP